MAEVGENEVSQSSDVACSSHDSTKPAKTCHFVPKEFLRHGVKRTASVAFPNDCEAAAEERCAGESIFADREFISQNRCEGESPVINFISWEKYNAEFSSSTWSSATVEESNPLDQKEREEGSTTAATERSVSSREKAFEILCGVASAAVTSMAALDDSLVDISVGREEVVDSSLLSSTSTLVDSGPKVELTACVFCQNAGGFSGMDVSSDSVSVNPLAIHLACWQGSTRLLKRACRLRDPDYLDESRSIVKELLVVGQIPARKSKGRGAAKRSAVTVEGKPADLAVRAGHFHCANLVLSIILYRWLKLAFWTKRRKCTRNIFKRPEKRILKDMLAYVGSHQCDSLRKFCKLKLNCESDAIYTLLAACILGLSDTVSAVFESVKASYWDSIDVEMNAQDGVCHCHEALTCKELVLRAAALGGDAACLKMILLAFHDNVSGSNIRGAWFCVMNLVWPWNLSQVCPCMNLLAEHPSYDGIGKTDLQKIFNLCHDSHKWMKNTEVLRQQYAYLNKTLPRTEEIIAQLEAAVPLAESMLQRDEMKTVDISLFLGKVLDSGRVMGPQSPFSNQLEQLLIFILTHKDTENILSGKDTSRILSEMNEDQQECLLAMLCQFMVVTNQERVCHNRLCTCPLCHPLVNFVCRVNKRYLPLLSEGNLWTVGLYFGSDGLKTAIDNLKKKRCYADLCGSHAADVSLGRFPLYGNLKRKKATRVVEILEDVRRGMTLRHGCLMSVLRSIGGDPRALQRLDMPEGLRGYFLLSGFVEKLCKE